MAIPEDIGSYLDSVYKGHSINDSSELHALATTLQKCLSKLGGEGSYNPSELKLELDCTRASSHALMSSSPSNGVTIRQIYTDSCLIQCLLDLTSDDKKEEEMFWLDCIRLLDGAIIFSGAPERMDMVQGLIEHIQSTKLVPIPSSSHWSPRFSSARHDGPLPFCGGTIPKIEEPDMISFLTTWCKRPFVIGQGIAHWPALSAHPWSSHQYLREVAGRGRVVPVEIGRDYRLDNWGQEMMEWEEFLEKVETGVDPLVYLAQHSLLSQFPKLREDICVPDLVYFSPTTEYGKYVPPANEDGVIINAWLGPKGTISPAHQVCAEIAFNLTAQTNLGPVL